MGFSRSTSGLTWWDGGAKGKVGGRCCCRNREFGDNDADSDAEGLRPPEAGSVALRRGTPGDEPPARAGDGERAVGEPLTADRVGEGAREWRWW